MNVSVLGGVVELARKVMADLDPTEVPTNLRNIAKSSAKKLPPPMVKILLRTIDDVPWLREQIADAYGGTDEAALLFLNRPEGWDSALEAITEASGAEADAQSMVSMERQLAAVTKERNSVRQRVKKLQRALDGQADRVQTLERELKNRGVSDAP